MQPYPRAMPPAAPTDFFVASVRTLSLLAPRWQATAPGDPSLVLVTNVDMGSKKQGFMVRCRATGTPAQGLPEGFRFGSRSLVYISGLWLPNQFVLSIERSSMRELHNCSTISTTLKLRANTRRCVASLALALALTAQYCGTTYFLTKCSARARSSLPNRWGSPSRT